MKAGTIVFVVSLTGLAVGFYNPSAALAPILIMVSFLGFIIAYEISNGSILNFYVPEIVQPKTAVIGVTIDSVN